MKVGSCAEDWESSFEQLFCSADNGMHKEVIIVCDELDQILGAKHESIKTSFLGALREIR